MNYIPWLISAGSLLIALLTFVRNGNKAASDTQEKQLRDLGDIHESLLKANMKLDQVCGTTNETRSDIKAMNSQLQEQDKRLIIVERDLKTAFNKIDEIKHLAVHTDDGK